MYLSTPYVPNILRISLLGPSTNLRPTHSNLTRISLPHSLPDQIHVNKLRYCRGLLAGSRAEVVGVMEIQRRPVIIETINKRVYLDHWVDPFDLPLFEEPSSSPRDHSLDTANSAGAVVGYSLRSSGLCNRVCVPRSSSVLRWRSAAVIPSHLPHTQPNHTTPIPPNHTHTWPRSVTGLRRIHGSEW